MDGDGSAVVIGESESFLVSEVAPLLPEARELLASPLRSLCGSLDSFGLMLWPLLPQKTWLCPWELVLPPGPDLHLRDDTLPLGGRFRPFQLLPGPVCLPPPSWLAATWLRTAHSTAGTALDLSGSLSPGPVQPEPQGRGVSPFPPPWFFCLSG